MIEKDYYPLNEVPKRFDINLPAVKALIDRKSITPHFYIKKTKLVVGGIDVDRTFIGYGVAEYQGMVAIQRSQFSKLWEEKETDANFLILQNHDGISNYSERNPFTARLPSGMIKSWQPTPLKELTRSRLIAICLPEAEMDDCWIRTDTFDSVDPTEPMDDYVLSRVINLKHEWLTEEVLRVKFSEALISSSDLMKSGVISCAPISDSENCIKATESTLVFKNDFEELVSKVIVAYPTLSAKEIFKILCAESQLEEDTRQFDKANILLDEVAGKIIWHDKFKRSPNKEKRVSLRYFENLMTSIKGNLR